MFRNTNKSLNGDEGLARDRAQPAVPRDVAVELKTRDETEEGVLPKMWAVYGKTYSPCEKATKSMPAGHYLIRNNPERGIFFSEKTVKMDELLILPDSISVEIIAGIEKFWTKEDHYRKFKFLWKRGILLWGPPGSGKTSTVQIIASKIVERDGIAIYVQNPALAIQGLDILRYIEPNRPIVVILEDLDDIVEKQGEAELLSLLDGEFQVDNAVFIATTNYPEELDQRIINRPSRFDIVEYIKMPSEEARRAYLIAKNPRLVGDELEQWIEDTEGYSIAHLKELIVATECLERPYEENLKRLDKMIEAEAHSSKGDQETVFGFTPPKK